MHIPQAVIATVKILQDAGYEAYIVGGAVRDSLLGLTPKDWDVATGALPEEVIGLFPKTVPTGLKFGTVTVIQDIPIEVTTFRKEGRYMDGRKPAEVELGVTIEEDLTRRDFTVNAIAYDPIAQRYVDPFRGREDLLNKPIVIKTVGDPAQVFADDALRLLRVYSLFAKLSVHAAKVAIADEVTRAVKQEAVRLKRISAERIQNELNKIITSAVPHLSLKYMEATNLLQQIVPELCLNIGVREEEQGDVFFHSLEVMRLVSPELAMRLAAMLHRVAQRRSWQGGQAECARESARLAKEILTRLKYSNEVIAKTVHLVANQLFVYPTAMPEVRRLVGKAGREHIYSLLELREADLQGSGAAVLEPLAKLRDKIDRVFKNNEAVAVKDLEVNGDDVIKALKIPPGAKVGEVLHRLLEIVLEKPELNAREKLLQYLQNYKGEGGRRMDKQTLAGYIDNTILKANARPEVIAAFCRESRELGFAAVCVNSGWVAIAREILQGSKTKVCCTVGFPLGTSTPEVKAFETVQSLADGAEEIDMVMNVGAFLAGDYQLVKKDMQAVKKAIRDNQSSGSAAAVLKVILETYFLSPEQIKTACRLAVEVGADFVKTSTGFAQGGATVEAVRLMREAVGPNIGVKASGGIRDLAQALAMIEAGANRIGASSGAKILEELG